MHNPTRDDIALEIRRTKAADRIAYYSTLTPEQKLAKLDARLGKGVGATKERAKLAGLMTEKPAAPKPKKEKKG